MTDYPRTDRPSPLQEYFLVYLLGYLEPSPYLPPLGFAPSALPLALVAVLKNLSRVSNSKPQLVSRQRWQWRHGTM